MPKCLEAVIRAKEGPTKYWSWGQKTYTLDAKTAIVGVFLLKNINIASYSALLTIVTKSCLHNSLETELHSFLWCGHLLLCSFLVDQNFFVWICPFFQKFHYSIVNCIF